MYKKLTRFLLLSTLLACGIMRSRAEENAAFGDTILYDGVVARLFPSVAPDAVVGRSPIMILRFTYGIPQEIQISIKGESGKETFETWRVPAGGPSIWDQVAALHSRLHTDDPGAIAKSINVEHLVIRQPSEQLKGIIMQFDRLAFSPALNEGVVLDGWQYELWFYSTGNSVHFSLGGPPGGISSRHPLIRWMASVRAAVEREMAGGHV